MSSNSKRVIAVVGATGQQGGSVVRALQARGQFKVRALTRNPDKHRALADEVVEADLNRPDSLKAAFQGAYGVFLVTNFWEEGVDKLKQATSAIRAAKGAGVKHFIWSTLPDVEAISGGKLDVPHIDELGNIAAGAFTHPNQAGHGEYLSLVGDFLSFNEIVATLNRQGHEFSFKQVPTEIFANSFPHAAEVAATFKHFQVHTYLGSDSRDRIALANKVAGRQPTPFSAWARVNFPTPQPTTKELS